MAKIWVVLKTEFTNTIRRRSFLLTLILVPLVPAIILGVVSLIQGKESSGGEISIFQPSQDDIRPEGYVDLAGIIEQTPEWVTEENLIVYQNESDARNALRNQKISGYYVIETDYIESGDLKYILEDFSPLSALESSWLINSVIEFNLLGSDPGIYQLFQMPVQIEHHDLSPEETGFDMSNPLAFYIPYGMTMLFYIVIMASASLMLNSISKEKENRVMEILITSIKPNQLLAGKVLGLGLVGLLQTGVWLGSAYFLMRMGGRTLNIPPNFQLSPQILFWGIIFFILGYLIYATLMAGTGALVPNLKEASQATFLMIIPLLIPLLLISLIVEQPHATLPVILSLIPFTAPSSIMTRMVVTQVPVWQILTSIGLTILTIALLVRSVAGMFRAQLLLTGKKFSLGLFIKALMGKPIETNNTHS